MILLSFFAAALAAPQPQPLKTFGDWTVGCDNVGRCKAVGLVPEEGGGEPPTTMSLGRDGGGEGRLSIQIDARDRSGIVAAKTGAASFALDPAIFEGSVEAAPDAVRPLLQALRSADRLELLDGKGAAIATLSLKGAAAALLYMDERQGRVGTVTALVRAGAKPAAAVPGPPATPRIRRAPPPTGAAVRISAAEWRSLKAKMGCDPDGFGPANANEVGRLAAGRSLLLLACHFGAYNVSSVPIVAWRTGGRLRTELAAFDHQDPWWKEEGKPLLVNAAWSEEERVLSSYAKGRGLGDCGTADEWTWDGSRFRLTERSEMDECRGSTDFIRTWVAERVDR